MAQDPYVLRLRAFWIDACQRIDGAGTGFDEVEQEAGSLYKLFSEAAHEAEKAAQADNYRVVDRQLHKAKGFLIKAIAETKKRKASGG